MKTHLLENLSAENAFLRIEPLDLFTKELTILGSQIEPLTFTRAIGLASSIQDFHPEKLGVKNFDLKDYEKAIEELKEGNISKAMFVI